MRPTARLLVLAAVASAPTPPQPLDVWMVPHAHCDVGWLMSLEGYFNQRRWDGSENSQSVDNILTEVTKALDADSSLRFIWSEAKWIEMWWPRQTPAMQAAMKRVVKRGQLEFVGGGWSQVNLKSLSSPDPHLSKKTCSMCNLYINPELD